MKSSRRLLSVALTITILSAGSLAWSWSRVTGAHRNEANAARKEAFALRQRLVRLRRANLRHSGTTAARSADSAAARPPCEAAANADSAKRADRFMTSPELQNLYQESRRAYYEEIFAEFFRERRIPPDQQVALIAAVVENEMRYRDLEAVAKQQGLEPNDAAIKAQSKAAEKALEQTAESILGPNPFKLTRDYSKLEPARNYVARYSGLFSRLGEPLTTAQQEAITAAFAGVAPKKGFDLKRLDEASWTKVNACAQSVLTPAQWELYTTAIPATSGTSPLQTTYLEATLDAAIRRATASSKNPASKP